MTIPRTEIEFRNALIDAAELGAKRALEMAGVVSTSIRLVDANRLYGIATIRRWTKQGVIHPVKRGMNNAAVWIARAELDAATKMVDRQKSFTRKK